MAGEKIKLKGLGIPDMQQYSHFPFKTNSYVAIKLQS